MAESNRRLQEEITRLEGQKYNLEQEIERAKEGDTCPTCGQTVESGDLEFHLGEREKELVELTNWIAQKEATRQLPTLDQLFEPGQLRTAQAHELQLRAQLKRAAAVLAEAQSRNGAVAAVQKQVADLREQRKAEKAKTPDDLEAKLADVRAKVERLEGKVNEKMGEITVLTEAVRKLEELRKDFRQIKSDIFATALTELGRTANEFLQELFETPVRIRFDNVQERGVTKIKTFVTIRGKERSLGLYSGGQFGRISIAVDLSLSKMVASRSAKPFNMRVLDEPCKDLSPQSKERLMNLLRRLPGVTILIEHDKEIQSSVDNNFRIEFRGGVSRKLT
jgi:DNA repair exonuclease SbcCD ATPase subunit